jgi:hypothetical protein
MQLDAMLFDAHVTHVERFGEFVYRKSLGALELVDDGKALGSADLGDETLVHPVFLRILREKSECEACWSTEYTEGTEKGANGESLLSLTASASVYSVDKISGPLVCVNPRNPRKSFPSRNALHPVPFHG